MSADFWCPQAWLPGGVSPGVLLRCADGVFTEVSTVDTPPPGAVRLDGLVFPGFANGHSHAFHRALRGRTHHGRGTFWTWREAMYSVAAQLDPDSYHRLARAVYAEMVLAGYTAVGEFHYLHHAPGGRRYADPNAMGAALRAAAAEAGIRLTLLDTCYLAGGIGRGLDPVQERFSDGSADDWAARVADLKPDANTVIGAAIHSVRAVPRDQLSAVRTDGPLHLHLSEQPAENEQCLAAYGRSPAALLAEAGVLGPLTTAVHATHLTAADIALLSDSSACFCPTTEADLADGIGPARELADHGARLVLGSDQHVTLDPFAELRGVEHGERLRTGVRGRFDPVELLRMSTVDGYRALGLPGGSLTAGAPADLVAVHTASPRTAGTRLDQLHLAATADDVHTVVVGGKTVVSQGHHQGVDVGAALTEEIEALWDPH